MLDLLKLIFTNAWYVALIALFFGGSIFVHELGHFLAARRRGLKVLRFSIGFGPKIFAWTRDGVEYRLSWIPLGGYVALPQLADMRGIEGEPGTEVEELPPISYTDKMIVAVMGAVFNLIFAFSLACILWVFKQPISVATLSTTVGYVAPTIDARQSDGTTKRVPSPAAVAHLEVGDKIIAVDGRRIENWNDISTSVVTGSRWADDGRREVVFTIERDQQTRDIVLNPRQIGDEMLRHVGIEPAYEAKVARVPKGSLAEQIGLRVDDYLVSYGGVPILNDLTYLNLLSDRGAETLELVVKRADQLVTLTVPPRPHPKVVGLVRDSIAHRLGIRNGDLLTAINGTPVTTSRQFTETVNDRVDEALTLTVVREAEKMEITIPARPDKAKIGIVVSQSLGETYTEDMRQIRVNPINQCIGVVKDSYRTLSSLVNPRSDIGLPLMSGPIEIVRIYHQVAKSGLSYVVLLTIIVNISLAIFNVLPIPVLDGGHMLFATIAKLRNRPLPVNFLMTTQSVFMMLLLTMVLYVSFFNVRRWVRQADRERAAAQIIWAGEEIPPPEAQ